MHVYRWDLDKTYLATEIGSVRGLIRAALEKASEKRNVPGAAALLRGLVETDPGCRVAVISGSPTQMRSVLEEKLALDGVRVDSLTLKDNLRNIRRGRLRAVTGQIGYKLPQLLRARIGLGSGVRETLFGDDCEVDALVYALYGDAVAGRVREEDVARVMEAGGAYPDAIDDAVRALQQVGRADAIEDIFILLDRATPPKRFDLLGGRVVPVFSWLQAALVLWDKRRLGSAQVAAVVAACADEARLAEAAVAGLVQDVVRRGHVRAERIQALFADPAAALLGPARIGVERALVRLGGPLPARPAPTADYLGFLRLVKS